MQDPSTPSLVECQPQSVIRGSIQEKLIFVDSLGLHKCILLHMVLGAVKVIPGTCLSLGPEFLVSMQVGPFRKPIGIVVPKSPPFRDVNIASVVFWHLFN